MYPITYPERPQCRVFVRERNRRDLHDAGVGNGIHRHAHPIERDRTVQYGDRRDLVRYLHVDQDGIVAWSHPEDFGHAVDVPLHEVPAQPFTNRQRPLEVHPRPHTQLAERRPFPGRNNGLDGKVAGAQLHDRQAGTVQRDTLAQHEIIKGGFDRQLQPVTVRADGRHRPLFFHDPCKHNSRSTTNSVSGPKARCSTTVQARASCKGTAPRAPKAGRPFPNQMGAFIQ